MRPLVLASTSRYRAELLRRLALPFVQESPGVAEDAFAGEAPEALARRLALEKARAVAARHRDALVIGSEHVAMLYGLTLAKPGTSATARAQLARASGRCVEFITAVALVDTCAGSSECAIDRTFVRFRRLDDDEIARYVEREPALDCAGSFKSEGLGVTLFEAIETRDPSALVGLPLIALCRMLRGAGLDPLG